MDDQSLMPFGKHKGKKMEEVPASYLLWLRDQGHTGEVRDYIDDRLAALIQECPDYIEQ